MAMASSTAEIEELLVSVGFNYGLKLRLDYSRITQP